VAYYKEPDQPANVDNAAPGPRLVSADDAEEAIASMCRIWGVYVTAGVIAMYEAEVKAFPREAVFRGVMRWINKPPENRAARPHELRALVESEVGQLEAPRENVEWLHKQRATPDQITQAYAEALAANPHAEFLQWAVEQRQGRLAAGESGEGEAEVEALQQALAGRRSFGRKREPGEEG
jgi:hypothetical protein